MQVRTGRNAAPQTPGTTPSRASTRRFRHSQQNRAVPVHQDASRCHAGSVFESPSRWRTPNLQLKRYSLSPALNFTSLPVPATVTLRTTDRVVHGVRKHRCHARRGKDIRGEYRVRRISSGLVNAKRSVRSKPRRITNLPRPHRYGQTSLFPYPHNGATTRLLWTVLPA